MGEKEFNKIKDAISVAQSSDSLSSGDTTLKSHGKFLGMDALVGTIPMLQFWIKRLNPFRLERYGLGMPLKSINISIIMTKMELK
jgi:hypothetical protein